MQSKAEQFELYAKECDKRADTAVDPQVKAVFRTTAIQWRELASTMSGLDADAASADEFFKSS